MRIDVRGAPSPEELAAVLAALACGPQTGEADPYRLWRDRRVQSMRSQWCRLER